jgi:hypothetical protein
VAFTGRPLKIHTGGDFTLSFWFYVDDWNYRANLSKFLFSLGPAFQTSVNDTTPSVLTAMLTPYRNAMFLQANVLDNKSSTPGSAPPATSAIPNINIPSNLESMMNGKMTTAMYNSVLTDGVEGASCNVMDVPIQRWVCITIVSSGRMLDVYMDGKLTRSCVLSNVVDVPRTSLAMYMGEFGGFGGSVSAVQMWNKQLTPDVIYGIYKAGPVSSKYDLFSALGMNVDFLGPTSGSEKGPSGGCLYNSARADYNAAKAQVSSWSDDIKRDFAGF